ncbi:MAG: hypothetical protein SPG03_06305 [Veillonella caviae]|uniref:hypothetical protein n=1 Tax=Veillonella caviae TaxID=248316 RepID=UPI002A915B14|nr:hypothetical protein [Veillonella caviae]MDY5481980.1 hypothetical protein [Veillonella caviae]
MATSSFFGPLKITKEQEPVWKDVFSESHKMHLNWDIIKASKFLNHQEAQELKKIILKR